MNNTARNKKQLFTKKYWLRDRGGNESTEQDPNVNPRERVSYKDVDYMAIEENDNLKSFTETNRELNIGSPSNVGTLPLVKVHGSPTSRHSVANVPGLHQENCTIGIDTKRKSAFDRLGPSVSKLGVPFSDHAVGTDDLLHTDVDENSSVIAKSKEHQGIPRKRNRSQSPQSNTRCKKVKSSYSQDITDECKNNKSCTDIPEEDHRYDYTHGNTTKRNADETRRSYNSNSSVSETNQSTANQQVSSKERQTIQCGSGRSGSRPAQLVSIPQEGSFPHFIERNGRYDSKRSIYSDKTAFSNESESRHFNSTEVKRDNQRYKRRGSFSNEKHLKRFQSKRRHHGEGNKDSHRSESRHSYTKGRHNDRYRSESRHSYTRERHNDRHRQTRDGHESKDNTFRPKSKLSNYREKNNGYHFSGCERQYWQEEHQMNSNVEVHNLYTTDVERKHIHRHSFDDKQKNDTRNRITNRNIGRTEQRRQPNQHMQNKRPGFKSKKQNGLLESSKKIELDKISKMNADDLAVHLSHNQNEFDTFLWKRRNIENILLLIDILGRLCESSCNSLVQKAIYPLKERKFFDRTDVRELICQLRSTESELIPEEFNLLTNLLTIMKGVTDHVNGDKTDLRQSLDSLTMISNLKIKNQNQKDSADTMIKSIEDSWKTKKSKNCDNKISFLSVLPDIAEIDCMDNHFDKKYENEEGYLNRLFMVHRQDFVRPLCKGLMCLKQNLNIDPTCLDRKWQHDDIRIYKDIQFLSKCCNRQKGITWKVEFDSKPYRKINWAATKLLMHGSLICLTNRAFDFIHYGIVANRDAEDLKIGVVEIKLHEVDRINDLINQEYIILIESQAFFPSYYHTLESIKNIHSSVFNEKAVLPFSQQIVYLDKTAQKPAYFQTRAFKEQGFDFSCFGPCIKMVDISDPSNWPHAYELRMDHSQYEALITAMKSKVALIQGPPGTGKTVVGLKIATLLLNNDRIWRSGKNGSDGPMLLISYTNHALDQFLLEIIKQVPFLDSQNVVRLGSRSENARLKEFNLTSHRYRHENNTESRPFSNAKQKLTFRMEKHENFSRMKNELNTGLVHASWFKDSGFMSKKHFKQLSKLGGIIEWLQIKNLIEVNLANLEKPEDIEYFENEFDVIDTQEPDFSDDEIDDNSYRFESQHLWNLDFEDLLMILSYDKVFHENRSYFNICPKPFWDTFTYEEKRLLMQKLEKQIRKAIPMTKEDELSIPDVGYLNPDMRWRLYKYWVQNAITAIDIKICECEQSYERAQDRFTEVQRTMDVKILKQSKLIACTTTRAARDIDILRIVSPKIILMEEAAEIPEHHVVSCLTPSCEQLIMIGDHQQLRPSYNDFETAREHQINISLFERLIRARFPRKCLKYQHRMRPTISKLLVPYIYRELEDDHSVQRYENVKGVQCNMFFVSHSVQEDNEREEASRSHKNTHEASFICSLYKYLRLQGYKSSQITILSPYLDQVRLLRTMARPIDEEFLNRHPADPSTDTAVGVRITAIDNFQGEENDIILISLVRSNLRRKIGYLKEANRICVALSRAKIGLYLIGDFELLSSESQLWKQIVADAQNRGFVGNSLSLVCQKHAFQTTVRNENDFKKVGDGGCQKKCKFKRDCGHYCSRTCHVEVSFHDEECTKECLKTVCERGHKCGRLCHYPFCCELCMEAIKKKLPKCGHLTQMPCHKDPNLGECKERCVQEISCGHRCQKTCTQPCNTEDDCNELIKATARCGHEVQVACHTRDDPPCTIPCREVLLCGHTCSGKCSDCSQGRLHVPCSKKCGRTLVCGHICEKWCINDCLPCTVTCERRCTHDGQCKKKCGDRCITCAEPCDWKCTTKCHNGYKCTKTCSETCDRPKCNVRCIKKLKCGHVCPGLLCEEKCIGICKVCNKDKISDICCFGTEDENDLVLIQLNDCKCIIEVATLDNFIKSKLDVDEDYEINSLKCPKCQVKITNSSRYRNEIRMINSDVENVFKAFKASNAQGMIDFTRKRQEVCSIMMRCSWKGDAKKINKYNHMIMKAPTIVNLNLIANVFSFLEEIARLNRELLVIGTFPFLSAWILRLELWVFMKRKRFSDQEHKEFNTETLRLDIILDINRFKKELVNQAKEDNAFSEEIEGYLMFLQSKETICDKELLRIKDRVTKLSSDVLGLTIEEKVMIKKAMQTEFMGSGHWYKCSNGHLYSIGECGMPMEQRKCPYCNVTIGGRSHLLSDQNEQAMDMETI